jgi:hypothetical protein
MMAISEADFPGVEEDLALRVLARARVIAPCIDSIEYGSPHYKTAVAILKGVIAEMPEPGSRRVKQMSRNGTSITLDDVASAFSADDVQSLRALCGAGRSPALPRGSFPEISIVDRLWPKETYP